LDYEQKSFSIRNNTHSDSARYGGFFSGYAIPCGDEYPKDEKDEGGSRIKPSRCIVGERNSFFKQYPRYKDFDYDWRISIPLRQLMFADEAGIEYGKKGKPKVSSKEQDELKKANAEIAAALDKKKS